MANKMKAVESTEKSGPYGIVVFAGCAFLALILIWSAVYISQNRVQVQDTGFKFRDPVCVNEGFYKDQCGTIVAQTAKGYVVDLGFEGQIEMESSALRKK